MIFLGINYVSTVKEGIIVFYGDNLKLLDKNFNKYRQKLEKEERKVMKNIIMKFLFKKWIY